MFLQKHVVRTEFEIYMFIIFSSCEWLVNDFKQKSTFHKGYRSTYLCIETGKLLKTKFKWQNIILCNIVGYIVKEFTSISKFRHSN